MPTGRRRPATPRAARLRRSRAPPPSAPCGRPGRSGFLQAGQPHVPPPSRPSRSFSACVFEVELARDGRLGKIFAAFPSANRAFSSRADKLLAEKPLLAHGLKAPRRRRLVLGANIVDRPVDLADRLAHDARDRRLAPSRRQRPRRLPEIMRRTRAKIDSVITTLSLTPQMGAASAFRSVEHSKPKMVC